MSNFAAANIIFLSTILAQVKLHVRLGRRCVELVCESVLGTRILTQFPDSLVKRKKIASPKQPQSSLPQNVKPANRKGTVRFIFHQLRGFADK